MYLRLISRAVFYALILLAIIRGLLFMLQSRELDFWSDFHWLDLWLFVLAIGGGFILSAAIAGIYESENRYDRKIELGSRQSYILILSSTLVVYLALRTLFQYLSFV